MLQTLKRRTRAATARHAQSLLLCVVRQILNVFYRTIKHIIAYQIFVTVEVIKSKLIIVILKKKRKGFCARVLCKIFNALKNARWQCHYTDNSRVFSNSNLC